MNNTLNKYLSDQITFLNGIEEFFTWKIDCDFRIIEINSKIGEILGYTQEELINKSFMNLLVEPNESKFPENLSNFHRMNHGSYKENILCKSKKWDAIQICFDCIPVKDIKNEVVGYEGIAYKK